MLSFNAKAKCAGCVFIVLLIVSSALWIGCGREQGSSDFIIGDEPTLGIFTYSLFGLDFIDKKKGWAVGKLGGVVHTEDGGQNWWAQKSGIDFHLYDVKFIDAQNGWAVGNLGSIIHTSDAGNNWEIQKSGTEEILMGVDFIDGNRGWAVGFFATMLKTDNGGKTWVLQEKIKAVLEPKKGLFLPTLLDIAFVDENNGWAVGFPGIILHTRDRGENWELKESGTSVVLNSICFTDALNGWIAGNGGTILHTEDGGQNWAAQDSGVESDLLRVVFADLKNGWIVVTV